MKNTITGLQLNLSTLQGVLGLNNPDIHCVIDGSIHNMKFGKYNIELPSGNHVISINIDPLFGPAIKEQTINFTVPENGLTCINYTIDIFNKSSIKIYGIIYHDENKTNEWTKTKNAASGLGYTLGRIVKVFKK
jgi:hypothetical protein